MSKCRVLELIGGSLTDGGAETLVKDYVLNIDKNKFETAVFVDWIIPETANTRILTDCDELIYTAYPRYSLFWRGINKFFRNIFLVKGIKKAINDFNPDVIHIHLAALHYLTLLEKNIKGKKLFYTCHSTVDAKLSSFPEEDNAARFLSKKYGMRFVALHDTMAMELNCKYGVKNSIVINNGITIEKFKQVCETKTEIRSSLKIPEEALVVGNVGRFVDAKNHNFILEVFEKIHDIRQNSFLLLIGDGEQLNDFRIKVEEKGLTESVIILSNRTDIPRLLKAMDVFLFPSLYEGLGIALVEAQAAGLRCVVSKSVPVAAFISDLVVPLDLSESIDVWCNTVLDKNKKGPYGNRLAEFDIKNAVSKLEKLYLGEI